MVEPFIKASLACLILAPMIAGAKAEGCDGTITADEALKAEDSRYAAQTKSDFDAMQQLFGDDLVYTHSSAAVDGKASYIEKQRAGLHYRVMKSSDVKVRVFGCLAIITGQGDYEVTVDGKDTTPHLRFTAIWAKRGPNAAVRLLGIHGNPQAVSNATRGKLTAACNKSMRASYVAPSLG